MDHGDRIKSPSVERKRLIEQRMDLISHLINEMNEGANNETSSKESKKRKRISDCNGITNFKRLGRFVNIIHRMFP